MLWFKFVDNVKTALAAHYLIIWTNFFNACTHFHADHLLSGGDSLLLILINLLKGLPFAVGDSALRKIVRGQLDRNAVARDDADEVFPHLAGNVSYDLMAVFKFYSKLSPWKGLDYSTCKFDYFLVYCHKYN
jgi:hypothetical protein